MQMNTQAMTKELMTTSCAVRTSFDPSLLGPRRGPAPAYVVRAGDRERIAHLLELAMPRVDEATRWAVLAEGTNWSLEKLLAPDDWAEPMTIAARSRQEDRWVCKQPGLRDMIVLDDDGAGYSPWFGVSVGGFVIAGLSAADDGFPSPDAGTAEDRLSATVALERSAILSRLDRLAEEGTPTRRYITSSLSADTVAGLTGRERSIIFSPTNMADLGVAEADRSWWVFKGVFDPAFNRRLRLSVSEGDGAGFSRALENEGALHRCADLGEVGGLVEDCNQVFFSARDFHAYFGEQIQFIDTLFLARLLEVPRGEGDEPGGLAQAWQYLVQRGVAVQSHCPWQRLWTLFLTALHEEARHAPPGDMARKIASSERCLICGPELTS